MRQLTVGVDVLGEFERLGRRDVGVGGGDRENDRVRVGDVLEAHLPNLQLDVLGLVPDRHLREQRNARNLWTVQQR